MSVMDRSTTGPSNAAPLDVPSKVADAPPADSASKLAEAIDEFLGDLEKKFKVISDEILTKLDDMGERCDRIEAELLMKNAVEGTTTGPKSSSAATGLGSGEKLP